MVAGGRGARVEKVALEIDAPRGIWISGPSKGVERAERIPVEGFMKGLMKAGELLRHLDLLTKPIDFEGLIALGILRKAGGSYLLLKRGLPKHAWKEVQAPP